MKNIKIIIFCFCICFPLYNYGQSFNDVSTLLGSPIAFSGRDYGSGISFYDFNKDGLDDITIPNVSDSVIFLINNGNGFDRVEIIPNEGKGKMVLWGDFDNDGDADLYVTFNEGVNRMYRQNENFEFEDVTEVLGLLKPAVQSYGASWGDINNDGFLDLLVCNYNDGPIGNWLFLNNNGESFTDVSAQYGVNIGSEYSFVGTFFDFNDDGKQDIHVANDRAPIDALYVNQGDYFVNNAVSAGMDTFVNSMCSSLADFNHDGRFDIYVTNTSDGNFLWRRTTDPLYYNVASAHGVTVNRWCWGASWADINNDSWEDLFVNNHPVANDLQPFFINQSGYFEQQNMVNDYPNPFSSFASAKGDFNNDGYYDFAINCDEYIPVKLLENTGGSNNFVKIGLEGVVSNRDGIGSLIEYTIGESTLKRYVTSATGYLTQDSQWIILGIGEYEKIDVLTITWMSGQVDVYENIPASSVLTLIEGFEQLYIGGAALNEVNHLCEGDYLALTVYSNDEVYWSNGEVGNSIEVNESGDYFAFTINEFGIENYSDTISVEIIQTPVIEYSLENISCFGVNDGAIALSEYDEVNYTILNQDGEIMENTNLMEGTYTIIASSIYGCSSSESVVIEMPEPIITEYITSNVLCAGAQNGTIEILNQSGGSGVLTTSLFYNNEEYDGSYWDALPPGEFVLSIVDENGCQLEQSFEILEPEEIVIDLSGLNVEGWFELNVSGGIAPYTILWNTQQVNNGNAILVDDGTNEFLVTDANNCTAAYNFEYEPPLIQSSLELENDNPIQVYFHENRLVFSKPVNSIRVFDGKGAEVYRNKSAHIDFELSLSSGLYVIIVNESSALQTLKIIVD